MCKNNKRGFVKCFGTTLVEQRAWGKEDFNRLNTKKREEGKDGRSLCGANYVLFAKCSPDKKACKIRDKGEKVVQRRSTSGGGRGCHEERRDTFS